MDCTSTRLPYRQSGAFQKIVLDYIDQLPALRTFYAHPPSLPGIQKAIEERKKFPVDRAILLNVLIEQYSSADTHPAVIKNINSLSSENTFTVTTAHQNNVFSGPLYFIYKIVHAIKLAAHLNETLKPLHFIPVFYMGTEDADLAELNHIYLGGKKREWHTKQSGAVGRMKTDEALAGLIKEIEGELGVQPHGQEIIGLIKKYYVKGKTIQEATFGFINALFGESGLVILMPDNPALKQHMNTVFEDELINQTASGIVEKTTEGLIQAGYRIQAHPREINLFYLEGNTRERIEKANEEWRVIHSDKKFSKEQILDELTRHPEKFSPNVILRGLYQENILPNIAFIGGGGELSYWLQLKALFDHYKIPFPVLVLRNSFLIVETKWNERITRLGHNVEDFFLSESELLNRIVMQNSSGKIKLNGSLEEIEKLYESFRKQAVAVDTTLDQHVNALKHRTLYRLQELEKKMLRAEKRKFTDQQRQIHAIREVLFPREGLQERTDSILYYYAKWGRDILDQLYKHSLALEQEFTVLREA
jgi:bacillithiol synthase